MRTDIRVQDIETYTIDAVCRTPLKFGSVVVDRVPLGLVRAQVENRAGAVAEGWGSMFLMHLWAWPKAEASPAARSAAMTGLFQAYAKRLRDWTDFGHPMEIILDTEEELHRLNREVCALHTLGETMPRLGALVAASPVDHALHDAFGKAAGIDSYRGYGPEHMGFDLSRYLGRDFAGVYPSQFLRTDYLHRVPVFHLIGGLDALHEDEVTEDAPQDGLPNSLDAWIERDGVFCLKVKLRGRDLDWDVERTLAVSRRYHEVRRTRRPSLPHRPALTADTNEQCESPEYVVEYLRKMRERAPDVFSEILYIEQPTERDLTAHRWDMRPIAAMKPVLIDESLTSPADFHLALELGWSGIALKSCKGLSSDLLFLAMAESAGIPYAVQDLTNPSLALIESVGLAARTRTILGVEANARQFFPRANDPIAGVHVGLCEIRDGYAYTASLCGPGLGFRIEECGGPERLVRG